MLSTSGHVCVWVNMEARTCPRTFADQQQIAETKTDSFGCDEYWGQHMQYRARQRMGILKREPCNLSTFSRQYHTKSRLCKHIKPIREI